jgi:LAO/AO transport system ATPase
MLDDLLDRLAGHDRNALSRLLSLIARGQYLEEIRSRLPRGAKPGRVVAFTGSGGVGKSTLVGKLIERARQEGLTVAVLACDPQSPLSGGALLGDRFRMPTRPDDEGVFIRSLAAASGQGGVAKHLDLMIRVLEAFGFDLVFLETVGAGQGDVTVRELADVVVLLLQPETGDDLQWEKAGILEVADVVVIHKADLPGADLLESRVQAILELSPARSVPVVRASARTGEGLGELWQAIQDIPAGRRSGLSARPDWARLAETMLHVVRERAEAADAANTKHILSLYKRGVVCPSEICRALLDLLGPTSEGSPRPSPEENRREGS